MPISIDISDLPTFRDALLRWKEEGRLEGKLEGQAAIVRRQLEWRFGILPAWAKREIATACEAALEDWGIRLLDASTLEEALGVLTPE